MSQFRSQRVVQAIVGILDFILRQGQTMLGIKKRREIIRSVFRKIYLGHIVENKWQVKMGSMEEIN